MIYHPSADRGLSTADFGILPFADARRIQERLIEQRLNDDCGDVLLFGQHPKTLSLGLRTREADIGLSEDAWREKGFDIVRTDRGGGPTLHMPGQLIVYPVVNLRRRKIGVRQFVELGLKAIAELLCEYGVSPSLDLCSPGVYLAATKKGPRLKIASVGLHINHGVTNHGFSLNVECSLEEFALFRPCGLSGSAVSSLAQASPAPDFSQVSRGVLERFRHYLTVNSAFPACIESHGLSV